MISRKRQLDPEALQRHLDDTLSLSRKTTVILRHVTPRFPAQASRYHELQSCVGERSVRRPGRDWYALRRFEPNAHAVRPC